MEYWEHVLAVLEKEKQNYILALAKGQAVDYSAYQNLIGVIHGIDVSMDLVKRTLRSIEDERSRDT